MKRVKLYGFEGCPYCQELRELFEGDDITFTYVDVDLKENKAEFKKIMEIGKTDSVPIILVHNTILSPEISFKSIEEAFKLTKKFLNE